MHISSRFKVFNYLNLFLYFSAYLLVFWFCFTIFDLVSLIRPFFYTDPPTLSPVWGCRICLVITTNTRSIDQNFDRFFSLSAAFSDKI